MRKSLSLITLISLVSCTSKPVGSNRNRNCNYNHSEKYLVNSKIVLDSLDCNNSLLERKTFDIDSEFSDAFYDSEGYVSIWKWYNKKITRGPMAIVYYKGDKFDSFSGNPFLWAVRKDSKTYIEMVNPPKVTFVDLLLDSSLQGKSRGSYDPFISDSLTTWAQLADLDDFKTDHKYKLYSYITDSNRNQAILLPGFIIIHEDYFEFKGTKSIISKLIK